MMNFMALQTFQPNHFIKLISTSGLHFKIAKHLMLVVCYDRRSPAGFKPVALTKQIWEEIKSTYSRSKSSHAISSRKITRLVWKKRF